jgi:hypothetical protein
MHDVKQLWQAQNKVENLRYEEQQECLTEMAENPNYRECHPSEVAKSISYKHF